MNPLLEEKANFFFFSYKSLINFIKLQETEGKQIYRFILQENEKIKN